jgi:hypothetical protein
VHLVLPEPEYPVAGRAAPWWRRTLTTRAIRWHAIASAIANTDVSRRLRQHRRQSPPAVRHLVTLFWVRGTFSDLLQSVAATAKHHSETSTNHVTCHKHISLSCTSQIFFIPDLHMLLPVSHMPRMCLPKLAIDSHRPCAIQIHAEPSISTNSDKVCTVAIETYRIFATYSPSRCSSNRDSEIESECLPFPCVLYVYACFLVSIKDRPTRVTHRQGSLWAGP